MSEVRMYDRLWIVTLVPGNYWSVTGGGERTRHHLLALVLDWRSGREKIFNTGQTRDGSFGELPFIPIYRLPWTR